MVPFLREAQSREPEGELAVITPTSDGKIIDCKGDRQTWGCGCGSCLPRRHPLDLGARLPRSRLREWAAMSDDIDRGIDRMCISCGKDARFYAGGWRCDEHA
jgi:hypothetical protein